MLYIYFLSHVFLNGVTPFNIDTKETIQEYSIDDKNLQFGYTVNFLSNGQLTVGAPPINQSDSGMDTGAIYSCDSRGGSCKKITGDPKPLVPGSTTRCFLPPYNKPCTGAGTSQTDFWYYDPLYISCKPFVPVCKKQVVKQNIFASEKNCLETCKREMTNRISDATQKRRASFCSVTFQNLHGSRVDLLQKDSRGDAYIYHRMGKGEVKLFNRGSDEVCGVPYVAKSVKTLEYLYFIDIANNSFDIVFTPSDGVTVSVGTMEQIRLAFYGENTPKLGLSVHTFQDRMIACEPQYNRKYVSAVGRCSMYKNDSLQYDTIPLEDRLRRNWQWWRYGGSVGGFTTTQIPGASSVFFTSAPNAWKAEGFIQALSSSEGKSLGGEHNPVLRTEAYLGRDSYFGYSLSSGRLEAYGRAGEIIGNIVAGSPRGGMKHSGYVLVIRFSENARNKFELLQKLANPDKQIGQYFGSAVCVADVNNNGWDDILVGSPYYTKVRDEGRVYVYMNKMKKDGYWYAGVVLRFTLEGKPIPGAGFGTSIANVGDINKDGFVDIAVGAPGGERGAVYIFNGNAQGINPMYSQVIDETDIPNLAKGFGISIAEGFDVNGDSYNDIAVGGHIGGTVYIFKAKPVIIMKRTQSINTTSILFKPESSNCKGPNNRAYYCVKLITLLSYTGEGVPDSYNVDITYYMDANKVSKRAMINDSTALVNKRTDRVELKRGIEKMISEIIFLKVEEYGVEADLFTPITLVTSYRASSGAQSCRKKLCPILPKVEDTNTVLGYVIKCSNTSYCKPYLRVSMNLDVDPTIQSRKNEIIYGVTKKIIITALINNTGEAAYQPKLMTKFRSDMDVNSAKWEERSLQWEISSIEPEDKSGNDRELSIYLPSISTNSQLAIVIHFSLAKRKPTTLLPYTFSTEATALDIHRTPQYHNKANVSALVSIETCEHVKQASAEPSPILYNPLKQSEGDEWTIEDGNSVTFSYYLRNSGQNTLDSLLFNVSLIDEIFGVRFMCVHSVIVDQVQCKGLANCRDYLRKKNGKKQKKLQHQERHIISSNCRVNSIEVGKGVAIYVKAVYFPDALGKLSQYKDEYVPDSYVDIGKYNITFAPIMSISHDDAFAVLHYQRADCPHDKSATATFIKVEPDVKKEVPFWTYIISVIAGLFLLLCIFLILRKYGFFNKNIKDISAPLMDNHDGDDQEEEDEDEE